jgi:inorganic pyrophosphatase
MVDGAGSGNQAGALFSRRPPRVAFSRMRERPAGRMFGRVAGLETLRPFDADGAVRMVVEAPRASALKLKYDPELAAFAYGRPLPLGLTYPFDWGFVPGTKAEDGDPLDALAIADVSSYPGVVIPCRPIGAVLLTQRRKKGGRERNDRLVLVPVAAARLQHLSDPRSLPARLRDEIEQFFLSTTFFEPKDARIQGWRSVAHATRLVRAAQRRFAAP